MRNKPDPFEWIIWIIIAFVMFSIVFACIWFGWFYRTAPMK